MKLQFFLPLLFSLSSLTPLAAADSKSHSEKSKESYLKKADAKVETWTAKLQALEQRAEKTGAHTRDEFDRHAKQVDENLVKLKSHIDEARTSDNGAWHSFKRKVDEAMKDTKRALAKAQSYLSKSESKEATK